MADLVVTIEDLVEYETAMKLKKKGYNMPCDMYYHIHDDIQDCISSLESTGGWCDFYNSENKYRCAAPSINNVLRWLMEEKDLHIEIIANASGYCYVVSHTPKRGGSDLCTCFDGGTNDAGEWDDYEEAALHAIEYVLDNLI